MGPTETMIDVPFEPHEKVRVAILGAGHRGRFLAGALGGLPDVEVKFLSDCSERALGISERWLRDVGRSVPSLIDAPDGGLEAAVTDPDVDLVVVATPWSTHAELVVQALKAGKHVAVEVPLARTLTEIWEIVEAAECAGRHCILLENCCYGEDELHLLRMVRAGVFGDLLHAEAGYLDEKCEQFFTTHTWWRDEMQQRDGNLYPTHGLGPVAGCLGINRGDRFARLSSFSTPALSLARWREGHPEHHDAPADYRCGDLNSSLIQTARGRTILVQFGVVSPRPYDRLNNLVGTKGVYEGNLRRVHLVPQPEGHDEIAHDEWRCLDEYGEFAHPAWADPESLRRLDPHGGMDVLLLSRLVDSMVAGRVPDLDVYDAAAWSAVTPLSELAVETAQVVDFPDFTRGAWQEPRVAVF